MKFSSLIERVSGETTDVWDSHSLAKKEKAAGKDVIVLSVGDPDFETPPGIIDAAVEAMRAGDTHYTAISGYTSLREAIAEQHRNSSGQLVSGANVITTSGAQNALFACAMCLAE
ncbi:MAG: arginine:pyruvate transaminase, partial [Gammaproteobacteria bacterium]